MKHNSFAICLVLALASCAFAQQSAPASQAPAAAPAMAQSPERAGIDAALKSYVNAYGNKSLDSLVAVWPDLANQKKDYKKIKEHLGDTTIYNDKVSMNSCEMQIVKDDALAKCERTEEYIKTQTDTSYGGDAMMASPAQRPPPTNTVEKKPMKKTETVWVKLHKNGDSWKIVSMSDKQATM